MGSCTRKCRLLRMKLQKHWMTIVWVALCITMFYIDYMRYKQEPQYYYLRRMLGIGMYISRGTAAVINLSCCVLVVPMCRALGTTLSSAFKSLMSQFHSEGTPKPRPPSLPPLLSSRATQTAKSLHLMIAITVMISSGVHTIAHMSNAINFSRYYNNQYPDINVAAFKGQSPYLLFVATVPGMTGVAMMVILFVLALTSTKWARRKNYDAFFYTHYLGLLFFILLIVHPLSGVLKEQKNLHGHIPGCQMFGISDTEEEGFPEPEPVDYFEVTANNSSSSKFKGTYYQSLDYFDEGKERDSSTHPDSYPHEVDSVDVRGNSEDDAAKERVGVKVYFRRKICTEAPVFNGIHSQTWIWISVALMLWAADITVRWWRQRTDVHVINVVHHPCDIVQLTLHQSGFSCTPGQYVLLQCPRVSRLEWHPFTVTCPPAEHMTDTFTILIRARGDWSSQVASLLRPSLKSSQLLHCDAQSDDASPLYSPIVKESSLRRTASSVTNKSSHPLHTHTPHDQYICKISKHDSLCTTSNLSSHVHSCMTKVEESKSYSFSPGLHEQENIKLFSNSAFCMTGSCIHSKCLYSNLSKFKDNTNSLPVDCRMLSSYSDSLQENMSRKQISYSAKSKCNTFSGGCAQYFVKKKHYCRNYVHNIKRNKDYAQTGDSYTEPQIHSQHNTKWHSSNTDTKWHSSNTAKQLREEKEDVAVNINSSCYTRLRVDGPYSSPSEEMLHYPVIIGTAGGVGITPLAATLSHKLWHPMMWPRRIHMVWVVRDARLLLVIAPLLSSLLLHCWQTNMEDCIELRLHVTIPTTQQVLQDLFGNDYPSLLPRISQGRPHWKHLFQEWRQVYARKKVGVFACGPSKMCRQVKRHCLQAVSRGAHFNYHQESFS